MLLFRSFAIAVFVAQLHAAPQIQILLTDAKSVTPTSSSQWKGEGYKAIAVVLDERAAETDLRSAAKAVSENSLDLYYWIEVARNPDMATKNPRWMAALGSHADWQKNFPSFPEPGIGQVAKAFPWVPIGYEEAFNAHLARIDQLLKRVPPGWRGLLLNDLQGGPSSCGCGNVQCRWALDYHVPATATKSPGNDAAARFVSEVRKRAPEKQIIPVWTTECSEADLPPNRNAGKQGTGFCGNVPCAHSACEEVFTAQWTDLSAADANSPIALLATYTSFHRTQPELGGGPTWVTNAVSYLHSTLKLREAKPFPADRLWVVVDGSQKSDETAAREAAAKSGVAGIIVSKIKIDQSYEPRMLRKE